MLRVFLSFVFIASALAEDWPTLHGDLQRSGYHAKFPDGKLTLAWRKELWRELTPPRAEVIIGGGLAFMGTYAGKMHAWDAATGAEKWTIETGGPIGHSPAFADGTLYFGSMDRRLRAVDAATGTERWSFEAGEGIWTSPCVWRGRVMFGDRAGNIGYRALGGIPVRSRSDKLHGRYARPGRTSADDWQEILPGELMPGVLNPAAGFIYSANHRPIETWYPIPLGAMTGGGGDTLRSWRLRERLTARERFTPEEVLEIGHDAVNLARRDIVALGLHLRDRQKQQLSDDALHALEVLDTWYRAGASSSLTEPGAAVAMELNTFFRFLSTKLAYVYGGGESGLAYFLKTAAARIKRDPQLKLSELEQDFIDQSLASAWRSCQKKFGNDPSGWQESARAALRQQRLGYYESLDPYPALDNTQAVAIPSLSNIDGGTIGCQSAQSYTQWVPMHDPDSAQSILPIGESERPGEPSRTSTLELWGNGRLHPAPLSRAKIEALGTTRLLLNHK